MTRKRVSTTTPQHKSELFFFERSDDPFNVTIKSCTNARWCSITGCGVFRIHPTLIIICEDPGTCREKRKKEKKKPASLRCFFFFFFAFLFFLVVVFHLKGNSHCLHSFEEPSLKKRKKKTLLQWKCGEEILLQSGNV